MDEQNVAVQGDATDRFDSLFYSKSDEKFTVRSYLDEILGERQFERTLDVGPGPGHVSEPLARRSKSIVMVEKSPEFRNILQKRFENARVIIEPIDKVYFDDPFDLILASHVLYYYPAKDWLPLLQRLHGMLSPGGELIVLLNADSGDWWKIVGHYWDELGKEMGFDYIPLTEFRKQIAHMGPMKTHSYRYQMWIDPSSDWGEFVGNQMLELRDQNVLRENHQRFSEFTKPFNKVDGSYVLDMRAEIIRIFAKG